MCGAFSSDYDDDVRSDDGRGADCVWVRGGCDIAAPARISSGRRIALFAAYYALYHTRNLHLPGLIAGKAEPSVEPPARKSSGPTTAIKIARAVASARYLTFVYPNEPTRLNLIGVV